MKNSKILLLPLVLFLVLQGVRANNANSPDSLSLRISKVEKSIDSISLKVTEQRKTAEYAEQTYQTAKNVFTWKDNLFFGGIALVSLIVAIITLFGIRDWIRNFVDRKVIELTERNTQEIKRLIENERWGIELKNRVKIIVLNKLKTRIKPEVLQVIEKFDYTEVDIEELTGESFKSALKVKNLVVRKNSFTIIIMDDNITDFAVNDGASFINEIRKLQIGILLYGEAKLPEYELKAFAKNPYSLYSNLNQLMKYMDFREN